MRFRKLLPVAIASALLLAGCTGGAPSSTSSAPEKIDTTAELSGDITFQTWSLKNDRFTPYFEKLIADFKKDHPKVNIKWIDQPGEGYEDKVLQQANSNELPDVINLPPEFAYKLAQANQLLDINSVASDTLKDYVEPAEKAYSYPGIEGTYAYAWYLGTDLNWWNVDVLKKAGVDTDNLPKTTDELFTVANQVAKATNGKVKMISEVPRTGTLSSAGIPIFENGKFVFNTPEAIALVEKYQEAYKNGAMVPEALNADYLGNSKLYKQGKVPWTTGSAGLASELNKEAPSLVEQTKVTPRIGHAPLFIQGISVAKNSKAPAAALAFAQFVTNNANQVDFLKLAQGFFPGTKEGNENPKQITDAIELPLQKLATEAAASAIGDAKPEYPIQFTYSMDTYLKQQLALAVQGKISAKEALDKAVDFANQNLAK